MVVRLLEAGVYLNFTTANYKPPLKKPDSVGTGSLSE
jgi:hypothetical protein